MKQLLKILFCGLGSLSTIIFLSCGTNNTVEVVGGGTEDGNSTLTGFATDESGAPLGKVTVIAVTPDYIPNPNNPISDSLMATTNSYGEFTINLKNNKTFNFWLEHVGSKKKLLLKNIQTGFGSRKLGQQILKPTGDIKLNLSQSLLDVYGNIAIPGTPYLKEVESTNISSGSITLTSLPIGNYDSLVYLPPSQPDSNFAIAKRLEVKANTLTLASDLSTWEESAKVILNTSPRGLNLTKTLTSYPLFLHLNSLDFNFSEARPQAEDLRFSSKSGNILPFEIENWDPEEQTADIWILVDTLEAQNENQFINMYWGNPECSAFETEEKLFSKSERYFGVYHLNESPDSQENNFKDASENANHGTASAAMASGISEITPFYKGLKFQENSQYVYISKPDSSPNIFTISLWFKSNSKQAGRLLGFGNKTNSNSVQRDRHLYIDSLGAIYFGVFPKITEDDFIGENDSGFIYYGPYTSLDNLPSMEEDPSFPGIRRIIQSENGYNDGNWHHIAASLSPQGAKLFIDGNLVGEMPTVTRGEYFTGYWKIGTDILGDWEHVRSKNEFLMGSIDEVRILHRELPSAQIVLDYQIQRPGQSPLIIFHSP